MKLRNALDLHYALNSLENLPLDERIKVKSCIENCLEKITLQYHTPEDIALRLKEVFNHIKQIQALY